MIRPGFLLVLLMPVSLLLQSCQQEPAHEQAEEINLDSVRARIVALENAYAEATNAKDVYGVSVYYAPDAESFAPIEPARVGMAAIKAGIKKDLESDITGNKVVYVTTGIWAAGNYATETGTITTLNKAGKVISTGKYMTLFELRNGKYIAIRDLWNSDGPVTSKGQ